MSNPCPRIYLSTGESSGDLHAAMLARALQQRFPGATLEGTGGDHLRKAGILVRHPLTRCGIAGTAEIAASIPHHWWLLRDLTKRFRAGMYDLLILIDYPGFHLRVARVASRMGIPILYYVAPQLWAWGEHRAKTLREVTRSLAVILPFEESFFRRLRLPATFVGHPLLDQPALSPRDEVRKSLGIPAGAPVLGLFPGSRPQEISRLWGPLREAARLVRERIPELVIVVAAMEGLCYSACDDFLFRWNDAASVLSASDALICKSGTATLQATLAGVPMVIGYRVHPLTHMLARRWLQIRRVGLVNLIAGREVAPEYLQDDMTSRSLAKAVLPLLDRDSPSARAQRTALAEIRNRLGSPGVAGRVAEMAAQLVA